MSLVGTVAKDRNVTLADALYQLWTLGCRTTSATIPALDLFTMHTHISIPDRRGVSTAMISLFALDKGVKPRST